MLGSFAVGKTSLVQRYVNSMFSEKYQTTIGVKIDQKSLIVDGKDINLLLWDIHGEDDYQKVKPTYLVGASGCFIVIDGTRKDSLKVACSLCEMTKQTIPDASIIVLINKADLKEEWDLDEDDMNRLKTEGYEVIETSAKTDTGVSEAFEKLARLMLNS